jgi:hypothetical protein
MIRIQGNGLDIARKIMLSKNGPYQTGVAASNFEQIAPSTFVENAIFFFEKDLETLYGVFLGDFISTSGASNGANNVTLKEILSITKTNDGTYIVIDGVTFVPEVGTSAVVSFRSKWDTFPDGCLMSADDVDLFEFDFLYRTFLSNFNFDFRLKESIEAKTFIEDKILRPMSAFSIQRKGRSSVGYHIGPIPGAELLKLDQTNIENADKLKIRRSISKNYYNTIIYQMDQDTLDGSYATVKTTSDSTSVADFNVGSRSMTILADGMRQTTQGPTRAVQSSNRFLNRYKRGAEFLDGVEVRFGDAFNAEIGDIVFLDTDALSVTDIKSGSRRGTLRIFQILNKTLDLKTGKVSLNLVDTNFSAASRYGLIGPCSKIKAGTSGTVFQIKSSFSSIYGTNEYLKWQRFGQCFVRVRSPDFVTRNATAQIDQISGNTVNLVTSLGFTPQADDVMEFSAYNDASEQIKFTYGFMRDTDPFDDGKNRYQML